MKRLRPFLKARSVVTGFVTASLVVLSGACGSSDQYLNHHVDARNGSQVDVQLPSGSEQFQITGGTVISEADRPEVVWIWMCTATAVSHNTIITASHCAGGQNVGVYDNDHFHNAPRSSRQKRLAQSVRRVDHPNHRGAYRVGPNDIAVAVFPDNTFSHWAPVRLSWPKANENVTLVGYAAAGNWRKKVGTNRIGSVNSMINVYLRSGSISQKGDSGGPMFVDGKLIGVTSGGSSSMQMYANLSRPENISFLRTMQEKYGAVITGLDD